MTPSRVKKVLTISFLISWAPASRFRPTHPRRTGHPKSTTYPKTFEISSILNRRRPVPYRKDGRITLRALKCGKLPAYWRKLLGTLGTLDTMNYLRHRDYRE